MEDEELHKLADLKSVMELTNLRYRYERIVNGKVIDSDLPEGCGLDVINQDTDGIYVSQVTSLFEFAMDSVKSAFAVSDCPDLPRSSVYVLVRAALETSAYADWLMSINNNNRRIFQSFKLLRENIVNTLEPFNENNSVHEYISAGSDWYLAYIDMKMHDLFPNKDPKARIDKTTILINCDEEYSRFGGSRAMYSSLAAWKFCSGITHGNGSLLSAIGRGRLTEVEQDDLEPERWVGKERLSGLVMVLSPVVENLEFFCKLYERELQVGQPNQPGE